MASIGLKSEFPSTEMVTFAAGLLPAADAWDGSEGPRSRVVVAPGSLTLERRDYARAERTQARWVDARKQRVAYLAAYLTEYGELPAEVEPSRVITEFSRKSRGRMVKTLTQLDYRPLFERAGFLLAMGTLTYPGDWLTVAPNGAAVKAHLKAFRKRFYRAWGVDLVCVWKHEFQRRGAPHFHYLHAPPFGTAIGDAWTVGAGEQYSRWLSLVWADIVAHPDPQERANHVGHGTDVSWADGLRSTDPKRVAVYFSKHGLFSAKEYQNQAPDQWQEPGKGAGRFWGYWGLRKATATVELTPSDYTTVVRTLRRWAHAQGTTRQMPRRSYLRGGEIRPKYTEVLGLAGAQLVGATVKRKWARPVRGRVAWLANGAGFVSLNDGPAFASVLAQHLVAVESEETAERRARLIAATGSIRVVVGRSAEPAVEEAHSVG